MLAAKKALMPLEKKIEEDDDRPEP